MSFSSSYGEAFAPDSERSVCSRTMGTRVERRAEASREWQRSRCGSACRYGREERRRRIFPEEEEGERERPETGG
jgi:hypothetical protein